MEKTSVVVMSNFRMSIEDTFLKILGYKHREGDTGRHINLVIQAIARCAVRNNPPCDINIYVLDQFTATRVQAQIGGSINEIDLKIGKTRKEPKHKMSVEDKKARERDRAKYNRLKRKGSLTPAQKMEFTRLSMLFAKGVKV
ncbi:hypothetical protein CDI09_14635 [Komagataeibacter nataicola]|uniref:Uncharacterized protein n=2 Tax=Komagataeibacter nataicola TaxID=265960 RepID=A0ABX5P8K3_9PROT|nr:hypothetical protein CDI09_14635 [Komagataeibacter nataicola]